MKRRPILEAVIWLLFAAVYSSGWNDPRPFWAALKIALTVAALARAGYALTGIVRNAMRKR